MTTTSIPALPARDEILVTAEALHETLLAERELPADAPRTRLLDVRWTLAQPDGRAAFAAGHIPGAVYVDLDTELARHGAPRDGRHPLPDPAAVQASARSWGIRSQDAVVAYDGGGNLSSARVWWMLRDAGFGRVRLLDGALPAWEAAGLPLETGDPAAIATGDVTLTSEQMPRIALSDVPAFVAGGHALLDARALERYTGSEEPIDPRAGHIPGALSAPTGANLDASGRFLPQVELRERFAHLLERAEKAASTANAAENNTRTRRVGAYCGSGVTAAHTLVALALAGIDGALYPGSWSQWSNHDELPAATGSDPAPALLRP